MSARGLRRTLRSALRTFRKNHPPPPPSCPSCGLSFAYIWRRRDPEVAADFKREERGPAPCPECAGPRSDWAEANGKVNAILVTHAPPREAYEAAED